VTKNQHFNINSLIDGGFSFSSGLMVEWVARWVEEFSLSSGLMVEWIARWVEGFSRSSGLMVEWVG
jgi:hypothetical protein